VKTFYRHLPLQTGSLVDLLENEQRFAAVPETWAVLMVDVMGSTEAIRLGFHHAVNLAATGAIVAVQNMLRELEPSLKAPYFFGGDGATFLMPEHLIGEVLEMLDRYKLHMSNRIDLRLKVGAHSVRGLYEKGHTIRIAKYAVNDLLTLPIVLGTGVKYAERVIKDVLEDDAEAEQFAVKAVDLEGMECRWDEVPPPRQADKVICLVALCQDDEKQGKAYAEVIKAIETNIGDYKSRQPISRARLTLDLAIGKVRKEMKAKLERFTFWDLLKEWLITLYGPFYFKYTGNGKAYLNSLTQLTHTLMFDGTLNCVITANAEGVERLTKALDAFEQDGSITYGLHVTHASVMSCYVIDKERDHAHFVDGTDGGFTKAATVLKGKLKG